MLLILQIFTFRRMEPSLFQKRCLFPGKWQKEHKYWPSVSRIDNAFGDRILFAPVHQSKNTPTSIIKFYYFGCFPNNPIFN